VNDTFISFYLKANRIHIFVEALRGIGSPAFVRFMISEDGKALLMAPYDKKDFSSHRVPAAVYQGKKSLELCSIRLCRIVSKMYGWDSNFSYRVPGTIMPRQSVVVFNLDEAAKISR